MIVVADSSPLIALARIGRLELLSSLFGSLVLPDAVWRELVATNIPRAGADLLLMDERRGRSAAKRLGLKVTGLVGVLIEARKQELLPDANIVADELVSKAGFWLSDELRRLVIGEEAAS